MRYGSFAVVLSLLISSQAVSQPIDYNQCVSTRSEEISRNQRVSPVEIARIVLSICEPALNNLIVEQNRDLLDHHSTKGSLYERMMMILLLKEDQRARAFNLAVSNAARREQR